MFREKIYEVIIHNFLALVEIFLNKKIGLIKGYNQSDFYYFLFLFYYFYFIRSILTELRIANKATPVSAKTASHIFAIPKAPRIRTRTLKARAKIIFCLTIFIVCFEILVSLGRVVRAVSGRNNL